MLGMKLVIVVLDNRGFGCINRLQQACGGAPFNNLFDDCIAGTDGAAAHRFRRACASPRRARRERRRRSPELEAALARARAAERTYVIASRPIPTDHRGGRLVVGRRGARGFGARKCARRARSATSSAKKAAAAMSDAGRAVQRASASTRSRGATTTCPRSAARRRSRSRSPKARRSATRASSSATSFRASQARCAAVLGRHGLALVSGWYSGRLARRSVEEEIAAVAPHLELLADNGADGDGLRRGRRQHPGRAAAAVQAAALLQAAMARYARPPDARSRGIRSRTAFASRITITWARTSRRRTTSTG